LAGEWYLTNLHHAVHEFSLDGVEEQIQAMLRGESRGRTLVNLWS
jgi:hypothetical protein